MWNARYLDRLKQPSDPTFTNPNAAHCWENVVVRANIFPATPGVTGPRGLVVQLQVIAADMNLYRKHYEASEALVRSAEQADVAKQQGQAQQVRPKL